MCGIAGIINFSGKVQNIPLHIRTITDTIRHRGPDGEGFLFSNGSELIAAYGKETPEEIISSSLNYAPGVSLENIQTDTIEFSFGHRRLSIIDVSPAGHQPMCDAEKQIWITYNGEIYNYVELREELKQKGFSFRTNTDTEVILQSYLQWGKECVNHFNGMWSFVIYDSRKNLLFGSRDRVGVKPFYYYQDKNVFAFASEQKALLKLPFIKSGINFKAASEFLAGDIYFIERGEQNMFENIFELLPAHNFRIDLKTKSFQKWKYYSLPSKTTFTDFDEKKFNEYRNEAERLLVSSVKLRLRSDVPVGSCLSGGIDSSAIVGIMGKLISSGEKVNLGGRLNVFTLKFNEPGIDESPWAKYIVDQTNAEWNLVTPSADDLLKDFQDMNYAQDIPVCTTGTYGQFQLMRRAKEKGIKVILDGQGGDELFGGYLSHSIVLWKELLRKGKTGRAISEMAGNKKLLLKDFLKRKYVSWMPFSMQESNYQSRFAQNGFLNRNVIHEYIYSQGLQQEQEVSRSSSLNEALLKDFMNGRLKMYLKYEDRSSMHHSIEARTPFADDLHLTEYIFSIPGVYKIHNGINKHLLREAAANYLPKEIKERKDKMGFVSPIDKWVKQIQKPAMDYFDSSMNDFIDVKKIKNNPEKFFEVSNHADGVRVFRTISFAVWKKLFNL